MKTPIRKTHPLFKVANSALVDMPIPSNISTFWNFGSLLGLCLIIQIVTGLFLSMHYTSDITLAFSSVAHIHRDVNYGWLYRSVHANGASFFFMCLYLHIGRGVYYGSFMNIPAWMVGVIILFLVMATAFLGYVLPWGQMSFWGATVITSLFSAVPYVGKMLVGWIWGGFAVQNATLVRFFSFHFLFPFIIAALSFIHIVFLHQMGANNPLGVTSNKDKLTFHPYFVYKDIMGFVIMIWILLTVSMLSPYVLMDPDNFIPANPMITPQHIQPEWYFLFAYAILRSIPDKLMGVIALVLSVLVLMTLPFTHKSKFRSLNFYPANKWMFWGFISIVVLLTWIGARPVEEPYILTGQILTVLYFSFYIMNPVVMQGWDFLTQNNKGD